MLALWLARCLGQEAHQHRADAIAIHYCPPAQCKRKKCMSAISLEKDELGCRQEDDRERAIALSCEALQLRD